MVSAMDLEEEFPSHILTYFKFHLLQSNHEHLFLQGEECLYLNTGDMVSETQDLLEGNGTRPVIGGPVGHSTLVSNKQWIVIQVSLFECVTWGL